MHGLLRTSIILVLPWFSPMVAQAQCAEGTTTGRLGELVKQVERTWVDMDVERVRTAGDSLAQGLRCVDEPLSPGLVARVHRAFGLTRVVDADLDGAARSFWAARYADPELGMSDALAPAGTPVRLLYEKPAPYVENVVLNRPRRGSLLIDGVSSLERPGGRPTVLQHQSASGNLLGTWRLPAGAPLPADPWADPRRGTRLGLRVGGLALTGVGLGLLAGAGWAASAHGDPKRVDQYDLGQLESLRDRSRAFTIAGASVGTIGLAGLGLSFSGSLQ